MCGIAGFWTGSAPATEWDAALERMTNALYRRGPDGSGAWTAAGRGVALGHRRLAIVDLSEGGRQPMHSASQRYVVTFNGEIYNYLELRKELQSLGHAFRSASDTEVLLAAVETWGLRSAIERVVGMFALALYDREQDTLHLVRDRLGKKPLYYTLDPGLLLFGSELQALRANPWWRSRALSAAGVGEFCRQGYVCAPRTLLEGVHKLVAGEILTLTAAQLRAGLADRVRYWSPAQVHADAAAQGWLTSEAQILEQLEPLLTDAVALRMVSDVPLGAFLSGGIDSSLITALMQSLSREPVRTFSIGFDSKQFDESAYASRVAAHLGTRHTALTLGERDALELVPTLPQVYDDPIADPSALPSILLSRITRPHVTVALSGDGGDEAFAGYERYRWFATLQRARVAGGPVAKFGGRLLRGAGKPSRPGVTRPGGNARLARWRERALRIGGVLAAESSLDAYQTLVRTSLHELVPGAPAAGRELASLASVHPIRMAQTVDQSTYLPENLMTKVDRAAMWNSLEVRAPLMDHRIVALGARIAPTLLDASRPSKWPLRTLLARHVPRELFERPKMGFAVPLDDWLRGPLRAWAEELLSEHALRSTGLLDVPLARTMWLDHAGDRVRNTYGVWSLLTLQGWWRHWNAG